MSKKPIKLDPVDRLIVGEGGPWATEKHDRLLGQSQAPPPNYGSCAGYSSSGVNRVARRNTCSHQSASGRLGCPAPATWRGGPGFPSAFPATAVGSPSLDSCPRI